MFGHNGWGRRRSDAFISAGPLARAMSCLEALLAPVAASAEAEIRPRLTGLFGSMLRAYLPQTWAFTTEEGTVFLTVDRDGAVRVVRSAPGPTDVTISVRHDLLAEALRTRRKEAIPPGQIDVRSHTTKGRVAFEQLRSRLGL